MRYVPLFTVPLFLPSREERGEVEERGVRGPFQRPSGLEMEQSEQMPGFDMILKFYSLLWV